MENVQSLEEKYEEILANIPSSEVSMEKTFFEINGRSYYELIIGSWYSYYLDQSEEHGLDRLFISSLTDILKEKDSSTSFDLDDYYVQQEVKTKKGNSIDIVIIDSKSNSKEAIIIELKVFAKLDNNLNDYYNSVLAENKVGVLLSIKEFTTEEMDCPNFICVTHLELLQKVKMNLGDYFQRTSPKQLTFLIDFITNLENISSTKTTMKEQTKFYLKHIVEINELLKIKSKADAELANQMGIALKECGLLYKNRSSGSSTYTHVQNGNMYLYWGYSEFAKSEIKFELWLRNEANNKWNELSLTDKEQLVKKYENPSEFEWEVRKQGKEWVNILIIKFQSEYSKEGKFTEYIQTKVESLNFRELLEDINGLVQ
jgi:hypothetical protein